MPLSFFLLLGVAFGISLLLTPLVGMLANRLNVVDIPSGRHQHERVVPRLGGLAIFLSVTVTVVATLPLSFELKQILALGFVFLMIGILDDAFDISPWSKLLAQLAGASVLVLSGLSINFFGNPFTGALVSLGAFAAIVTVLWIITVVNVINLTDGIDGLVSGVTVISALVLAFLSYQTGHPNTAKLALILAGGSLGFLVYNFYPAKIFLGDSGTMFIGFLLGVLGFLGGAKIATAMLILGIPILDAGFIILYRAMKGKPIYQGDRNHLHFRLRDRGISPIKICLFFYSVTAALGAIALFFSGREKLIALSILILFFALLWTFLIRWERKLK
jgi:UDP-GlcNAc:undecaprenyl-phosphate GlcNAc-1-phosphate transferase